ncbi:YitT family protein [Butyricicoccus sp.]|uniref:YitT family protein n=1 Tax=Butyricicoccus sp. TaxID=2049021 RepID=UPI00373704FF
MGKQLLLLFQQIRARSCVIALCSSAFLAFGLYQVHSLSGVTEGGVLGLTLLLEHWWGISPSVSGGLLNLVCYAVGWKLLGQTFLVYSFVATAGFSLSYHFWECFEPFWPQLADMPLAAAVIGALFVGIGTGFCVRAGGAISGDDALAMSIAHVTRINIKWIYLLSDIAVLMLSLSYIPVQRIAYSLLTVVLSGQIIGVMQKIHKPEKVDMCRD